MTATDELRRLLDEHGVDYDTPRSCKIDSDTTWHVGEIYYDAFERTDGAIELTAEWEYELTPEQAIAATLGSGTLTAEQVRKAIFDGSVYASYDGAQYYANGISMQAIADELNARAERTCECVAEYAKSPIDGKTIVLHRCSACNELMRPHMNYCPSCGSKVRDE